MAKTLRPTVRSMLLSMSESSPCTAGHSPLPLRLQPMRSAQRSILRTWSGRPPVASNARCPELETASGQERSRFSVRTFVRRMRHRRARAKPPFVRDHRVVPRRQRVRATRHASRRLVARQTGTENRVRAHVTPTLSRGMRMRRFDFNQVTRRHLGDRGGRRWRVGDGLHDNPARVPWSRSATALPHYSAIRRPSKMRAQSPFER